MIPWNALWRLCRFDKPVGTLLLWFPTAWALWFANKGTPPFRLLLLFFLGTVFMRAAGCIFNDIADRTIDKQVARTQFRPLAAGEITLVQALFALAAFLFAALFIAITLPKNCIYLAIYSLLVTFIYPFCKRFLKAPQMVLGLAFSMGIPMAYCASKISINKECVLLFVVNFLWIVAYDTMYAMTDKEDDLKIGVNSTAIYFSHYDRFIIGTLHMVMQGLWLFWALAHHVDLGFYLFWLMGCGVMVMQQRLISLRLPQDCFKAFKISAYYGCFMWCAIVLAFF